MNLYEIDNELEKLINSLDVESEIGNDFILEQINALGLIFETKIENIACYILNLRADAKAIKEQEAVLKARRERCESKSDRLEEYLGSILRGAARKYPRVTIGYRASAVIEVDDCFVSWAEENDPEKVRVETTKTPNKKALMDAMKQGEVFDFARIVEKSNIQIK